MSENEMISIDTTAISSCKDNGIAYDRKPIHPVRSNFPLKSEGNGIDCFREMKQGVNKGISEGIDRVLFRGEIRLEFELDEKIGDITVG